MIAYIIGILPFIKNLNRELLDVTQPWYVDYSGSFGVFEINETYFHFLTRQGLGCIYYPRLSQTYWLCIQRISGLEYCLVLFMGINCQQARVISSVISVITSTNTIGLEIVCWCGCGTFAWSDKPQVNIPSRVMLRCYAQSNQGGYFLNMSLGIQGNSLW